MKPRVFIASSVEGKGIAGAIQLGLQHDARCIIWHQAFPLSGTTIDTLLERCAENDFAIVVFSPDDLSTIRNQQYMVARDNLLFEAGLFMGMRGRDRAFIITPLSSPSFHIPSDLQGLTTAGYDTEWAKTSANAAVGPAVTQILQAIERSSWSRPRVAVVAKTTLDPSATFPLKLHFTFTNKHTVPLYLEGQDFVCAHGVSIASNAMAYTGGSPWYLIGKTSEGKDDYRKMCVLDPGASAKMWVAIDPAFGKPALDSAISSRAAGTLKYRAVWLTDPPMSQDIEKEI